LGGGFAPQGILVKITGGTGKYEGASGGGTYTSEAFFKDTLAAGKYKATIELR